MAYLEGKLTAMDSATINNVIYHLNTHEIYMPYAWINSYGNNGSHVPGLTVILDELIRLRLVETSSDNKGYKTYLLNLQSRNAISSLPNTNGKTKKLFMSITPK